ncbi:hypothetical protein ACFOYW_17785 [Gryllotalpicola reticulitermitis]|uniref:PBP domain-containing protein n=1 Tax=Gryllotalpicola reticulitermitis TaxID=1184153 RepID=A0ABV8QBI1_9MICO
MTPPRISHRLLRPETRPSNALHAAAGLFLVIGLTAFALQPAQAADSSGWGAQGSTGPTDSAVTVNWQNTATETDGSPQPADDVVPRDDSQVLPYTGGKTYADADPRVSSAISRVFKNLSLTVDQTESLGNQTVTLSYTGVGQGGTNGTATDGPLLDVMQCWGADDSDNPDPAHCESGVGGVDSGIAYGLPSRQIAPGSPDSQLIAGGTLPYTPALTVTGYMDASGTSAHLFAQTDSGGQNPSPSAGSVQFETASGQKLGAPVSLVNGVAAADVGGLAKDASVQLTAEFTPAEGQNYTPSTAPAIELPQQNAVGSSGSADAYSGSLFDYVIAAGTFRSGDKLSATLNEFDGTSVVNGHSTWEVGARVQAFGQFTAASDGSADLFVPISASLPTDGSGYLVIVRDLTHPSLAPALSAAATPILGVSKLTAPAQVGTTDNVAPHNESSYVPFEDIQGNPEQDGAISDFTNNTTNEMTDWEAPSTPDAETSRNFDLQTTLQQPGLGCGVKSGVKSIDTCWLVAVPVDQNVAPFSDDGGVLAPSDWGQRLQVKLGFAPISTSCSANQSRVLTVGGELMSSAVASWAPALCSQANLSLGYDSVADSVAREQYEEGSTSIVLTSQPVSDSGGAKTVYAPAGVAAVTVSLNLPTQTGQVTDLKLSARLVAKLVTESYTAGINPGAGFYDTDVATQTVGGVALTAFAPWAPRAEFADLFDDPEFRALNPGFNYTLPSHASGSFDDRGSLIVTSTASDPVVALWQWILADPAALAFLNGCPDDDSVLNGSPTVINPYFSTESYAQCASQAGALKKTAQAEIAETQSQYQKYARADAANLASFNPPSSFSYTYNYSPVTYSADDPQFPLPSWYELPPAGAPSASQSLDTSANIHEEEPSLAQVEADVTAGAPPSLAQWCDEAAGNTSCTSGAGTNGEWAKQPASIYNPVMGLTDSPAAAQFQTVTAELCDDNANCVGANSTSLQKAASVFQSTSTPGVKATLTTPDEANGAYPLTLPVYAEINTNCLATADASAYASLLSYIAGAGNTPGLAVGELPPGYAPLSSSMLAQDASAIATLKKAAITPSCVTPAGASTPTGGVPGASNKPLPSPAGSGGAPPPSAQAPVQPPTLPSTSTVPGAPTAKAAVRPSAEALPASQLTSSTAIGFPVYGIYVGFGGAVAFAAAAAVLRTRSRRAGAR